MPPEPDPADPGWDEDLAWLDRDPERETWLDRAREHDDPPLEVEYAAAFGPGMPLDVLPGCAQLAVSADAAADEDRFDGVPEGELVGLLCAWDRIEAHQLDETEARAAENKVLDRAGRLTPGGPDQPGLRSARSRVWVGARVWVEAWMRPLIVEVPSPLGLRPSGVERAPAALRAAGLHARLGCDDAQHVAVPVYDDRRDIATGVLNPGGIAEVAFSLADVIEFALQAGRLPVVLGGDCSIVLGPLLALRRRGRYGLVYLDGHADFQHPGDEPHGEVASLDLALATGRGPRPLTDLDGLAPLVRAEDVVLAGYRVFDDNDRFGTEHVRDSGITVLDYRDLRAGTIPLILDRALAIVTRPGLQGFWVHLDVDVLDDAIMPAVDYRHPGGLSWDEAAELLRGLLSRPGARGLNVTIFNPNLDPDGSIARQLAELIARCVPAA